jgi:hypothetical protein
MRREKFGSLECLHAVRPLSSGACGIDGIAGAVGGAFFYHFGGVRPAVSPLQNMPSLRQFALAREAKLSLLLCV